MRWRRSKLWVFLGLVPVLSAQKMVGSKECARCHADIVNRYASTPMANASGKAGVGEPDKPPPGAFTNAASNTRYIVASGSLEYKKNELVAGQEVRGRKALTYYVGSGTHARGYLFREQGKFFQGPIAYYPGRKTWDMAPGFETGKHIFFGRQIQPGCLNCHASGIQLESEAPFTEGAVTCERCHGPGSTHVAKVLAGQPNQTSGILNPAKLAPLERDSICAQCHLTGEARIAKPGKSETTFHAGDKLTEHVVPFVWSTPKEKELKVVGHFEGLWISRCKRETGDKLWCGTCHDPHTIVPAERKAAYYRDKCFTCHSNASCKLDLHARMTSGNDCTACHMPKRQTVDGLHTAFTDHSIPRRPIESAAEAKTEGDLKPFWEGSASGREVALAYGELAWRTQAEPDHRRAFIKLQTAVRDAPQDGEMLAELGYIADLSGEAEKAAGFYSQALKVAPNNITALSNQARHLALQGESEQAADMWRRALLIDPGLASPGINLVRVLISQRDFASARRVIDEVLSFNPDLETALALRGQIDRKSMAPTP